ncbi:sensor histidine kinase [Croceimicrobium hydrocarbonivorans]|uniref:Histidine kinase n=1 Tax=Croceimicrobium hydrocarbonivorans TaxID=2761580 RepID=A0A7H0VBK8_9FLAO|nr:histidine kinase [Croceimicrobium hydrocarbonivorans]QNR23106.1 histidine kinase [Croceimicrobium hydrocarbonivorans]
MESTSPYSRQEILRWIGISALLGIILPVFYSFESYWTLQGLSKIWDDMLYSFMMSLGISLSVGLNEHLLDRRFPWLEHPGKRLILEILGISLFGFSASFLMNVLFFTLFGMIDYNNFPWETMLNNALIPLYVGYVISAIFISRGFLGRAKAEAVRAEKLQTEKYRSEVRVLRDQLNPHFLFNSLNILTNMVYEDADRSAAYIRQLSRFYRYVLEVQDEDTVELERELQFIRDYIQLQQERFGGDALQYSEKLFPNPDFQIPPLALQLLLENALKHNRCSSAEPLKIEIIQEGNSLIIRNNIQKRSVQSEHLGIGLSNLIRRYELLKADLPQINSDEAHFTVKIPLLLKA